MLLCITHHQVHTILWHNRTPHTGDVGSEVENTCGVCTHLTRSLHPSQTTSRRTLCIIMSTMHATHTPACMPYTHSRMPHTHMHVHVRRREPAQGREAPNSPVSRWAVLGAHHVNDLRDRSTRRAVYHTARCTSPACMHAQLCVLSVDACCPWVHGERE